MFREEENRREREEGGKEGDEGMVEFNEVERDILMKILQAHLDILDRKGVMFTCVENIFSKIATEDILQSLITVKKNE